MGRYVLRRILLAFPTLFCILLATFLMIRLAPGDPADAFLEEIRATPETLARLRHHLGLDRPLPVQFAYYVGRAVRGEFGTSYFHGRPVLDLLRSRLPFTLELALAATVLSVLLGIPLGMAAALHRASALDYLISTVAVLGYSLPRFWVGLLLILIFALRLEWFPVIGGGAGGSLPSRLSHLVLPAIAVGISQTALLARMTRTSLLEVLQQDYVRTARSKGLPGRIVLGRHALRPALIPVVTVVGLGIGHLLTGSIVVETVFVRPGLGTLLVEAIRSRDYPVVQGTLLFFGMGIVVLNIVVDLVYTALDPRVRYG